MMKKLICIATTSALAIMQSVHARPEEVPGPAEAQDTVAVIREGDTKLEYQDEFSASAGEDTELDLGDDTEGPGEYDEDDPEYEFKDDEDDTEKRESEEFVVKETKDTVYVLKKESIERFKRGFRGHLQKMREKGIGGSGGPMFGMTALYVKPIEDMLKGNKYAYDFSRYNFEPIFGVSGVGYGGVGNGIRIGGGGMSGRLDKSSENSVYNADLDTFEFADLEIKVSWGGFLLEKAYVIEKTNYLVGGYIGKGEIELEQTRYATDQFARLRSNFDQQNETGREPARIDMFVLEAHAGATYSVYPFVHLGGEISVPIFMSSNKYQDFISPNPGFRLKIIFGTLG
ncbi:MAG: hypothetical protein GF398_12130 [Chitinivibrionales bacterium]|nr:hypothetical protein [Chitinivibrionales bacterium]